MIYACGFLLLFASWLQPLHILPWVSWHSEMLAFSAGLCLTWQMVFTLARQSPISTFSVPVVALPFVWLCVLTGAQWGLGMIPFFGDLLVDSAYLLLCISCIILGHYIGREQPAIIEGMAAAIFVAALVSAIIALLQSVELAGGFDWIHAMPGVRRPGANLGQPNQLATLLLMGLASLLFFYESKKLGGAAASLTALALIISLAATESRAGMLGFLVLNLWYFSKLKSVLAHPKKWVIVSFGTAYFCLFWCWPYLMGELYQLPGGAMPANAVAFNRWAIWQQLLQAVFIHPWIGWGIGQVSTAHNAVVDAYVVSEPYTYAHNVVLDLALGVGVPFSILLILMSGAWLWRRLRASGNTHSWYSVAVVIPVATHSMVEFPFAYAYFLVPAMLALGAIDAQLGFQCKVRWRIKPYAIGLFIVTVLFTGSAFEYMKIEEDFRIVRFEAMRVGRTPKEYDRPRVYMLSQLEALLTAGRLTPEPGMSDREIELAKKVAFRHPWIATQNRYALALALNGNPIEATRQLRVMRAQHGAKAYSKIKVAWVTLAKEKYPQLNAIGLP